MADVTKTNARNLPAPQYTHCSPFGNLSTLLFVLATTSGIMDDGDKATALVAADVCILGILPGGMRLDDAVFNIPAAFTAATVLDVGFQYVDGVDDADVPESVDYFADAIVASSAARLRNVSPDALVTLPKDAYLIVTIAGATQAATSRMEVLVNGLLTGADE